MPAIAIDVRREVDAGLSITREENRVVVAGHPDDIGILAWNIRQLAIRTARSEAISTLSSIPITRTFDRPLCPPSSNSAERDVPRIEVHDGREYLMGVSGSTPRPEVADWYTLWFENQAGQDRVVTRDGRIRWARTPAGAQAFSDSHDGGQTTEEPEVEAVCDVAELFWAVSSGEPGFEGSVSTRSITSTTSSTAWPHLASTMERSWIA